MSRTLAIVSETKRQLTVNEVIAFNLARARRRKGWTQEETAEKLTEVTGKRWTKGTLGPAERSWETDRVREFNGDELAAFCLVFGQPLTYFFLPPDIGEPDQTFLAGPRGKAISELEWLCAILPLGASLEFRDLADAATRRHNMNWAPSRPSWYREEEHSEEREEGESEEEQRREEETADAIPSGPAVVEDAKQQRILSLLAEIRQLVAPEEYPPF